MRLSCWWRLIIRSRRDHRRIMRWRSYVLRERYSWWSRYMRRWSWRWCSNMRGSCRRIGKHSRICSSMRSRCSICCRICISCNIRNSDCNWWRWIYFGNFNFYFILAIRRFGSSSFRVPRN